MPFSASTDRAGDVLIVVFRGVIDLASADDARRELEAALAEEPRLVVADLSDVGVIDSTGVGTLIAAAESEGPSGFAILAPGGLHVRGVLSVTGVLDELTVFESREEIVLQ